MSSQSHQKTTSPQVSADQSSSESGSSQSQGSNEQQAASIRTAEGTAKGLENYQATLGQWLGGELYGAIAPLVTLDKMSGYADKALLSAFSALAGELEKLDPANNEKDLAKFSAAFKEAFGTAAGEWLKTDGSGLASGLAGWVDANPELIATAALLAAAGAIIANASIPELSTSLGLGEDLKLKLGANIGTLRNISLRQVSAELSHATAPLVAAIKVSTGDTPKTEFSGSYGGDERKVTVSGEVTGQDLNLLEIQGLLQTGQGGTLSGGYTQSKGNEKINVDFTGKDGNTTRVTGVDYDPGNGTLTLRNVLTQTEGSSTQKYSSSVSSDGSNSQSLSLSNNLTENLSGSLSLSQAATRLGASDSYQLTETQKASLGLNYTASDLKAALSLSTDNNSHSASGSADWSNASGLQGGANASKTWGTSESLQVGAYFGFKNPDEFETYMAKYTYKDSGSASHNLDLMLEQKIGPIYTRIQQQLNNSASGTDWTTTAQGAYFVSDKVALIGGAQYTGNSSGDHSFAPQIGAQINGIPLVVTHDFDSGTTTLGVTFKFGR